MFIKGYIIVHKYSKSNCTAGAVRGEANLPEHPQSVHFSKQTHTNKMFDFEKKVKVME